MLTMYIHLTYISGSEYVINFLINHKNFGFSKPYCIVGQNYILIPTHIKRTCFSR